MTDDTPELDVRQHGGVLRLTIQREARRNAISPAVLKGLSEALTAANADRGVRAIVLTGAGEKAFCAGADLQSGQSFKFDYSEPTQGFANLFRLTRQLNVPLIARVNGACMAGGMGLMAMCDMVVAAPHAVFGLPEVKVGVFPAQVLSVLNGLIGARALAELCITGEPITAKEALALGLINHVSEDLDAGVQALLDRFLDKSPAAIRRGLYLMKRIGAMSFEESMAFTESQIALFALTEDAAEGQAAFREKRKPNWSGR
ncbi:MAG: enoyl-CoA hydratase/isomerase family protein [Burkholderiaceae bacterium]|nr:enoyl-CoA hydratase/isomerase family protein [Pseudomonadota bacterium]MBS0598897.1 enoyl-CoA hydratase/isomerase family protein [Pseudomonadota bacterium]MCO5117885.1 enoyl-CoA hydratase/isomerase family protein [Burkholderiaceae bacterium]MCP5216806.1 enoyl-CoA hydratase/isomerase family protein [Burkholderiaceae bacterium]